MLARLHLAPQDNLTNQLLAIQDDTKPAARAQVGENEENEEKV